VNLEQHSIHHPVVGGIYRDKSDSSLVVLTVVDNEALLEYANGTITTIDVTNWRLLQFRPALF
jgi:hypothetical protein